MEEKTPGQQLREALLNEKKNGWDVVDEATERAIADYCEGYKASVSYTHLTLPTICSV